MISKVIREKIEERFGKRIRYPKDCEALASEISFCTKQQVSTTTVKRLLGFIKGTQEPRTYTLDLIAEYLGHSSFDDLISQFTLPTKPEQVIKELTSDNIEKGQKLKLTYEPGKQLILSCIEPGLFEVMVCDGKSLRLKDQIRFSNITVAYPLFLDDVIRYGKSLGQSTVAKVSGITVIEILSEEE